MCVYLSSGPISVLWRHTKLWSLTLAVADLGESVRDARPWVQILSIPFSLWGNLAKWYVDAPPEGWCPHLGQIGNPPLPSKAAWKTNIGILFKSKDCNLWILNTLGTRMHSSRMCTDHCIDCIPSWTVSGGRGLPKYLRGSA